MFLDSAIVTKLVVHEPDSAFYGKLISSQKATCWVSHLAFTECFSALCRKERDGLMSRAAREASWRRIENYFTTNALSVVPLDETVLAAANRAIEVCGRKAPLKTLDAIQIASCEHTASWPLVTNDQRMRQAAEVLGIPLGPLPEV